MTDLRGFDTSIPLQAGRNLPTFGPDYNAIAEMQRTQIAMQNAKQVQDAQNALKALYSDQNNFDAKTLQPTQNAMAQLMRTSPQMGMDLSNNLAAMQEKNARLAYTQSEVTQAKQAEAQRLRLSFIKANDANLAAGMPQKEAYEAAVREVWAPGIAGLKTGLPPSVSNSIPSSPDMQTVRRNAAAYIDPKVAEKEAEIDVDVKKTTAVEAAKAKQEFSTKTDPLKNVEYRQYKDGHTTDLAGNPFTPSGVGTAKLEAPFKVETLDGKTLDVRHTATGGLQDAITGDPVDPKTIKPGSINKEGGAPKYGKPSEIVIDDPENPGKTKTVLAQQDPKSGQWVTADANRDPLPTPKSIMSSGTAGGRESIYIQRALTSGQEAVSQLKTIAQLPAGASSGWFGLGRTQGVSPFAATKEVLVNKVSSQEVQEYKTLAAGLQRELASLAASGVGVNQHYIDAFNSDMLAEGDTQETKLLKLARQRQTAENALEAVLANPRLGEDQRKLAESQIKGLQEAVPWTPMDVVNLLHSEKPGETLSDMAKGKGLGNQGGKENPVAPAKGAAAEVPDWAAAALKQHPEKRDEFDKKFGAGAAAKVLGQ